MKAGTRHMLWRGRRGRGRLVKLFCFDPSEYPDQTLTDGQTVACQVGEFKVKDSDGGHVTIAGGVLKVDDFSTNPAIGVELDADGKASGVAFVDDLTPSASSGIETGVDSALGRPTLQNWTDGSCRVNGNLVSVAAAAAKTRRVCGMVHVSRRFLYFRDGVLYLVGSVDDPEAAFSWFNLGGDSGAVELYKTAVVDLPASGYRRWSRDWTEVTDSLSAPANGATYEHEPSAEITMTYTHESSAGTTTLQWKYTDNNNQARVMAFAAGAFYVQKVVNGTITTLKVESSVFSDGVEYEIKVVTTPAACSVYVNGELKLSNGDISDVPASTAGRVAHSLSTNDIEVVVHPWPALGPATARAIYPEADDSIDCPNDAILMLNDITLPSANTINVLARVTSGGNPKYVKLEINSSGDVTVLQNAGGVYTSLISASGAISSGESLELRMIGGEIWLWKFKDDGSSFSKVGSSSSCTVLTGDGKAYVDSLGTKGMIGYLASWQTDLSRLLPPLGGRC